MRSEMTPWELRGYLTFPRSDGKPRAGTREEMNWCIGWERARREDHMAKTNQLTFDIYQESEYGRETFAAQYRD